MAPNPYSAEFVEGHAVARRGVAWLKHETNKHLNAKTVFNHLPISHEMYLRASFDAWLDGKADLNSRYHGWSETKYRNVQVFKWRENRVRHRLYGFKLHPGKEGQVPDGRFEMCVLAMHTTKNEALADPWYKNQMNHLRDENLVSEAIRKQIENFFGATRQ